MRRQTSSRASTRRRPTMGWLLSACIFLTCLSATAARKLVMLKDVPREYRTLCSDIRASPLAGKSQAKALSWLLHVTAESSLKLTSSPQHQAACWMLYGDPIRKKVRGSRAWFEQRYAMATFFHGTKGPTAWYPDIGNPNATTSAIKRDKRNEWLSNSHECTWYGVECTSKIPFTGKFVTSIDISFFGVNGILPREMGLLTSLNELDLHGNDLQGVIPLLSVVGWKKLEVLRLHMNGFFGNIHREIGGMKKLKRLVMFGNYFGGTIPKELAQCNQLEEIDLYANQLEGTIPSELASLPKLKKLDLHDNNLVGRMPKEICNRKLPVLIADCLGPQPEVTCDCCTVCCRGLPQFKCVDVKTGESVIPN